VPETIGCSLTRGGGAERRRLCPTGTQPVAGVNASALEEHSWRDPFSSAEFTARQHVASDVARGEITGHYLKHSEVVRS